MRKYKYTAKPKKKINKKEEIKTYTEENEKKILEELKRIEALQFHNSFQRFLW